ncbi:TRL-like family protein [Leptospira ryugenii]|uniref:TRL-like family protein n=1 Tax=Leptospira ryugenii TaxID=1917863 RepID=A0A2P2DYI2_9LEPT|nr:TRL domain-containing protein [Leptospira ryugenii]GBF49691.1 TRL-like family protein [Leptospira ryugenii]
MKKYIALASVFAVALAIACSGGGYSAPSGSIMQDTSLTLSPQADFTPATAVGSKSGEACVTAYVGIISSGDASLKAAAAAGGITKINYVDYKNTSLLGSVISTTCTIARGD